MGGCSWARQMEMARWEFSGDGGEGIGDVLGEVVWGGVIVGGSPGGNFPGAVWSS